MPLKKKNPEKRNEMMNAMGFGEPDDMANYEKMLYGGDVENDADLEAELLALTGGGGPSPSRSARPPPPSSSSTRQKPMPTSASKSRGHHEIMPDFMNEDDIPDEDIDVAEDDPELLAELQEFVSDGSPTTQMDTHISLPVRSAASRSPVPVPAPVPSSSGNSELISLIEDRISQYKQKLSNSAGLPTPQLRRFERGLKTLEECLMKAKKGITIDEDDIPPPLPKSAAPPPSIVNEPPPPAAAPPPPARVTQPIAAPPPPSTPSGGHNPREEAIKLLRQRQAQYKQAALKAKSQGNLDAAKEYLLVSKNFEEAIFYVQQGSEPIDLSDMPPPPDQWVIGTLTGPKQDSDSDEEPPEPPAAPAKSMTLLEALQARRVVFQGQLKKAEQEDNSSKLRRMQRIVSQYEDAIKACQRKAPFDYQDLVSLPGMDPLPLQSAAAASSSSAVAASSVGGGGGAPTAVMKQVAFLKQRQQQFRAKALECKQRGDLVGAKDFLSKSKGFDQLIIAASSGLPVDLSKLPSLPGDKTTAMGSASVSMVTSGIDCPTPPELLQGETITILPKLQRILQSQVLKVAESVNCLRKINDLMAAKRMEELLAHTKQDFNLLNEIERRKLSLPKFHFEWRMLSMANTNPDLAEDEMEMTIIKATSLALPEGFTADQMDTYVRGELVFPTDTPAQVITSDVIKRTNSPEYNASTKFKVANRKSRAMQRLVKSKTINLDVFYRRGFLKKDGQLGTVAVKLEDLEKYCTIDKPFDLLSGRKAIGGSVHVRVRIREPIVGGLTCEQQEKWLVIDTPRGAPGSAAAGSGGGARGSASSSPESLDVLLYEKQLMQEKIVQLQDQLTPMMLDTLKQSVGDLDMRIKSLQRDLAEPLNVNFVRQYVAGIEPLSKTFTHQAHEALQQGQREKAQILLTKKKLIEKEVVKLRSQMR